jgi:hypothetical protein
MMSGEWMLDAGCWILDAGCWILDTGYSILDASAFAEASDFACATPDKPADKRCSIPDSQFSIQRIIFQIFVINFCGQAVA